MVTWMEKEIWAVTQLMNKRGEFLNYREFCNKYNMQCSVKEYEKVMKAIPVPIKTMISQTSIHSCNTFELRPLSIEGINLGSKQFTNKFTRNTLSTYYYPTQLKRKYVLQEFTDEEAKKIRTRFLSYPILPKAKEVMFKILNDIYPSNNFLHTKFNLENNSCGFCERDVETAEHLFFQCKIVNDLWLAFQEWLSSKNITIKPLTVMLVKTGVFMEEKNVEFLVNNLMLIGKHFTHKCKYIKVKPHIERWKNELKQFAKSLHFFYVCPGDST